MAKGTDSYSMVLLYGPTVLPASFRAELNGENVTNLFRPEPADAGAVHLPLRAERNTLKVTISGKLADHIASDVDRSPSTFAETLRSPIRAGAFCRTGAARVG
ncbi:MAG: hypothetical protein ACM3JB_21825 [Acidobacteriaceae bacterium]